MTAPNQDIQPKRNLAARLLQGLQRLQQRQPHYFLLLLITLVPLLFIRPDIWLMLTISGAAMGLLIFIMASGMTLTFGLMSVLNLGHGAFIAVGAYLGAAVLALAQQCWPSSAAGGRG